MSNRPIEPDCLAMIRRGKHIGMPVRVIDRAPSPTANRMPNGVYSAGGPGMWIIDMPRALLVSYDSGIKRHVTMVVTHERNLLRIDDHGEDADDYEVIREEWGITA